MTATQARKRTKANGEGSVREELHNGRKRWKGTFTVGYDGDRQVRRVVTGRTKAEVLAKMREAQNASDAGLELARRDLTVARFLEDWLTNILPDTVAPATLQQYRDVCRIYIVPLIGQKRLVSLTPSDVSKMVRHLGTEYVRKDGQKGVSPHTQRIARSVLRRALRWAEDQGLLVRNVARIAPGVRIGHTAGRTMTPDDAKVLLDTVATHRNAAAFTVALSCGLRLGELLGLSWDDIDLEAQRPRLTIHQSLKRHNATGLVLEDTKTASSRRTVLLPTFAADALRQHRKAQRLERVAAGPAWDKKPLGADLVFRTPIGTAIDPDNFRRTVYQVTEQAGLGRWSPHELRHSCASLLIAQGVPLKIISELLGHSSIRMTADVYGHLLEPARAEAADAMDRMISGGR
ncbi:MAG: site-specific integrase [Acidobacteria bacterium]|nr:site-specific integrase [Acidobacteriota bacterium]